MFITFFDIPPDLTFGVDFPLLGAASPGFQKLNSDAIFQFAFALERIVAKRRPLLAL